MLTFKLEKIEQLWQVIYHFKACVLSILYFWKSENSFFPTLSGFRGNRSHIYNVYIYISVCHLAGVVINHLKENNQEDLKISDHEEKCVEIAALCQDIGKYLWNYFLFSVDYLKALPVILNSNLNFFSNPKFF